jgi:hypothetical protein
VFPPLRPLGGVDDPAGSMILQVRPAFFLQVCLAFFGLFLWEEFISKLCQQINLPLKFQNDCNRRALISKQWVDEKRKVPILIEILHSCVQNGQFELQIFLHIIGVLAEGVVVPQHRLAMDIASPD